MTSNINNFFNLNYKDVTGHIFGYLPAPDLYNVALTSKNMLALSYSQRLKTAQETLEEANKLRGIIQLPSFVKSEDLNYYNTAICSIKEKIKSIPIFQKIFAMKKGDFGQIAQEIQDRDLVLVFKKIAPQHIQQQMERLSNFRAAAAVRNWLKDLDPRDNFFQTINLDLHGLKLTSIPPEIFTYFPHLQALDLSENNIQIIPPEIGQLLNLQGLNLSSNQIQVIPLEIGQLLNLERLSLSKNQIRVLPPEFGQLQNLQGLFLENNQIQVIPSEIGQLLNLEVLDLSSNQIQVIPSEIGQLLNLRELVLDNNQIQVVPPEIGQLLNLLVLYLSNNQIQVLLLAIRQLQNLRSLAIRGNPISLSERVEIYWELVVAHSPEIYREWVATHSPTKLTYAICISAALILFQTLYRKLDISL